MPLPVQVHEISSTTDDKGVPIAIQTLEQKTAIVVYRSLPEAFRLSPNMFEVWQADWGGAQRIWPPRDWVECLIEWLNEGSRLFRPEELSNSDRRCFEKLQSVGEELLAEIESLKTQHLTAAT